MRAHVVFSLGGALVDLESGELELTDDGPPPRPTVPETGLPLMIAADAHGSRIVAVVARRPPLVVSDDAGISWREAGGGLPAGVDVALGERPDDILFASARRLHVSHDGGLFWRAVPVELDGVTAVAWAD